MAQITRSTKIGGSTTLGANTVARAADVETDVLTLFSAHNNHDSGTTKWQIVNAENASSTPLIANNSSGTQTIFEARDNGTAVFTVKDGGQLTGSYLSSWLSYRRPNLQFINVTTVDVEVNTTTANTTTIVFNDGEVRTVTEDTSSANKYRRFDITAAAVFTSGTEDSGVRSGITEATNTWYAIYAVKSQIDATKFVLAADTTLPLVANASTLNTRYATSGWVFLGMIRNGDNAGATGDILNFVQHGSTTMLRNAATGNVLNTAGLRLATTASAVSLTYSTSDGTGTTDMPNHIRVVGMYGASGSGSGSAEFGNGATTQEWAAGSGTSRFAARVWTHVVDAKVTNPSASAMDIFLFAWVDPVLGTGINPLV
jgi:hypothetical protein